MSPETIFGLTFAGMVASATVGNSIMQFRSTRRSERRDAIANEALAQSERNHLLAKAIEAQVTKVELTVNGRLSQLLEVTRALARAEGRAEERAASVIDPAVTALAAEKVLSVAAEAKALLSVVDHPPIMPAVPPGA